MTEIIPFPLEEAQSRVVPLWQRRGILYALPHPLERGRSQLAACLLTRPICDIESVLSLNKGLRTFVTEQVEKDLDLFLLLLRTRRKVLTKVLGFDPRDLDGAGDFYFFDADDLDRTDLEGNNPEELMQVRFDCELTLLRDLKRSLLEV